MPPRYAYWTIILDDAPTSFRTKEREEILPLFNQLKAKNPAALLKWFSGGKIWDSPDQAREARAVEKVRAFREQRSQQAKAEREGGEDPLAEFRKQHGRPADGSDDPSILRQAQDRPEQGRGATRERDERSLGAGPSPRQHSGWSPGASAPGSPKAHPGSERPHRRSKDWRPGGEHKDPRDKYKLPPGEARKRWKDRNLGPRGPKPPFGDSPRGDSPRSNRPGDSPRGDRPWGDKPRSPKPFGGKPFGSKPPFGDSPRGNRPGDSPRGDRPWGDKPRSPKPFGGKPFGSKPPFGDSPRGPKPFGSKPGGPRPFGGGPKGPGGPRPFRGKPGKPGGPRGKR